MMDSAATLPFEFLHTAFPFHLVIDSQLRITQIGEGMAKRYSQMETTPLLLENFRFLRPRTSLNFETLSQIKNVVVVLQSLHDPLKFKGVFTYLPEQQVLLFLGSPWVTSMDEANSLGLKLTDFPIHDGAGDYLIALQVHQTALSDTRKLAEELKEQRERLSEANRQLQAREAQLSSIVTTAVDAIIVIDEYGIVEMFNSAAEKIFGYRAEEVLGQNVSALMPSPDREQHDGHLSHFTETGEKHIIGTMRQTYAQRKDGTLFPIELSVSEMRVGGRYKFTGIVRDISVRLRMETELREREQFYSQVYHHAPVMLHTMNTEWVLTSVNDYWQQVLGYNAEEVVGRDVRELLTPTSRSLAEFMRSIYIAEGYFENIHLQVYKKNREVLEILVSGLAEYNEAGERTGTFVVGIDVTARRQAERALEESERRNRQVLASTLDAVVLIDAEGYVTEWNDRAVALFGWTTTEIIGKPMRDYLIPPHFREAHDSGLKHYLNTGVGAILNQRIEIVALRKDGSEFPIEMTVSPIQFGGKTFFCAFIQDITARKQEVEIGARIQQTLLTRRPPTSVPGLQIAARSLASQRVDGDYFDFFTFGKSRLDLVVADIMGKGIPAALLGAGSKSLFQRVIRHLTHSLLPYGCLPQAHEIVNSVHRLLTPDLIALNSYLTLCYAHFDLEQYVCNFVDCGHPRMIHYRAKTGEIVLLNGENLPLGFTDNEIYVPCSTSFAPGDIFVFYSDGITEALCPSGQMLGESGLVEMLHSVQEWTADVLLEHVYQKVQEFTKQSSVMDDQTLVVVQVTAERVSANSRKAVVELMSLVDEQDRLLQEVRDFCLQHTQHQEDSEALIKVVLAVGEAFTNIVEHAYQLQPQHKVLVELELGASELEIRLFDWGVPFSWSAIEDPLLDGSHERGFGMHIIRSCMDSVHYDLDGVGRNRLILTKLL